MKIIWKPGVLNLLNAETIPNSIIWEQSDHKLTAKEFWGIGNITSTLTRLGGNITRKHNDKAASGEYRIPKPPNKPGGYGNIGVSAALIVGAAISKRLAAGQSSVEKRKDTTQCSR